MRKIAILSLSTFVLAFAAMVIPTSQSQAHYRYFNLAKFCKYHPASHKCAKPSVRDHNHAGQWAVGCGIAAASGAMIVSAIKGSDKEDPRQATIFEAGWSVSACPVFLPWSLLVTALCPDNKATYEIARQAYRLNARAGVIDNTPFTNAYYQACREGTLSKDFLAFLKANHLPLSSYYLSAKSKPVLRARG